MASHGADRCGRGAAAAPTRNIHVPAARECDRSSFLKDMETKCSALHSVRRLLARWAGFSGSPVGLDEHGDDDRGDETSSGLDEDCN